MDWGIFRGRVSIVCVGNELDGDDAAGLLAYRGLEGGKDAQVIYAHTAPENYIDEIVEHKPDKAIIIDAADFGGFPGEFRLIDADKIQQTHFSTHRAPLKMFKESLARRGIKVYFAGIQAVRVGLGEKPSEEVERAVAEIVKNIKTARDERI